MSGLSIQILNPSEIAPEVWNGVTAEAGRSPMVLHDWTMCTVPTDAGGAVKVLVAGPPEAPRALVPLLVAPGLLARHEFIGNNDGGVDIPARDDAGLAAVARGLVALPAAVNLLYYPSRSKLFDHIATAARGKAVVLRKPQDKPAAPYIDLDESWALPERHLKKKMAQSIRRRERRLKELGEMRMAFLEPTADEVEALMDTVVHVEGQGWKQRAGTALLNDDTQRDFLRRYARTIAPEGRLHITFLYLDDRPIAMSIGEIYNNAYWGHKTGFDEAFRKYGPGILMQYHLIRHLAERGVTRLDFRGQLDEFKRAWTDKAVPTTTLRIYPFTPRGIAALAVDAARQGWSALAAGVASLRARRRTPGAGAAGKAETPAPRTGP